MTIENEECNHEHITERDDGKIVCINSYCQKNFSFREYREIIREAERNRVLDKVDDWNNFMNESVSHVKLKRKITALRQSQTKEGEK